jgi:uncharacterized membrane protein YbhN (UPF0104 family)
MNESSAGEPVRGDEPSSSRRRERLRRTRHVLSEVRTHLGGRALHLLGFLLVVYLVLKLIPGLEKALKSLEGVKPLGLLALAGIEVLSESGYAFAWRGVLDPDALLRQEGRGKYLGARVAWAQLGGGMVVPGGSLGSIGVGAWMLRRLGMPVSQVLRRQLTLILLNTAIDALAIIFFGVGLASGLFGGSYSDVLTVLPAAIVTAALGLVLLISRSSAKTHAKQPRWPRIAKARETARTAVKDTAQLLRQRGSRQVVLGAVAYLLLDMIVLQGAFVALDAHDRPDLAVVGMSYLIGALGGSIPLPANLGAVGGITAMLVVFGVNQDDAIAAVVVYQAIGFLVPLIGGGIAYLFLRREFGAMGVAESAEP